MKWFAWFRTRSSKVRLNFLDLLRAGYTDYVLNDAAYDYMRNQGLQYGGSDRPSESQTADAVPATRSPGRRISTGWASTR